MKKILAYSGIIVLILGAVITGTTWVRAQEQTDSEQTEDITAAQQTINTIAAATEVLQQRQVADDAKEEGIEEGKKQAAKEIQEMCDDGRITGDVCDAE